MNRIRISHDGTGFLITEAPADLIGTADGPLRYTTLDLAGRAVSQLGRDGDGVRISNDRYHLDTWGTVWGFTPTRAYAHGKTSVSTPLTGIGTVYPADGGGWTAMDITGAAVADGDRPYFQSAEDAADAAFTVFTNGLRPWQRDHIAKWLARLTTGA